MLAIVDNQQERLVLECRRQRLDRTTWSTETDAQDVANNGGYQLRIIKRGEFREPYAVRITVEEAPPRLDREPGLADPARPGQRHQAMTAQPRLDVREIGFAPDQTGELLGKVVARGSNSRGHRRAPVGGGCGRSFELGGALAIHRRHEAITPPGDGEQVAFAIAACGQDLAQGGNVNL